MYVATKKNKELRFALLLVILPALLAYYKKNSNNFIEVNENFHIGLVIISSAIAILASLVALKEFKNSNEVRVYFISIGFLGVSIIYAYHALITPNTQIALAFDFPNINANINAFVLTGDLSRLWLALTFFMPDYIIRTLKFEKKPFKFWCIVGVVLIVITWLVLKNSNLLPILKTADGNDTTAAILLKVLTMVAIGINIMRYFYSYNALNNRAVLSMLIGMILIFESIVLFMISKPWDSIWWLSHFVFLMSYLSILSGIVYSLKTNNKFAYFDTFKIIKNYIETLENKNVELDKLTKHDVLTGLQNRIVMVDKMKQKINEEVPFRVLNIDLDGFKSVNDTFGHQIGDEVLKIVASRLDSSIKVTDDVFRIGGDEFIVIVNDVTLKEAKMVADRLIDCISQVINIDEITCTVGASIGISSYPNDGIEIKILIYKSDRAMYNSKKNGKSNYEFAE